MKYVLLTITALTLTGAAATYKVASAAQQIVPALAAAPTTTHGYCHQEIICGPVGGCQWVWVCD